MHPITTAVDLNADIGEGFPNDAALIPYLSSANIACGGHAGNADTMRNAVLQCLKNSVSIGAHPSFPDPLNFGRKEMKIPNKEWLSNTITQQMNDLTAVATSLGTTIAYVKPHGALYNISAVNPLVAEWIATIIYNFDASMAVMGLFGSHSLSQAQHIGLATISESFADRLYLPDGSLASRNLPNAVHSDEFIVANQAFAIATGAPFFVNKNEYLQIKAESICLHGDTPFALSFAHQIHCKLLSGGISIQSNLPKKRQ